MHHVHQEGIFQLGVVIAATSDDMVIGLGQVKLRHSGVGCTGATVRHVHSLLLF